MANQLELFTTRHSEVRKRIDSFNKRDESNGWVKYGADNLYPQNLLALFYNSPFVSGIIGRMTDYVAGSGVYGTVNGQRSEQATEYLKTLNKGQGLEELLYRTALDYLLYGGFCWQIIYEMAETEQGDKPLGAIDLLHQEWSMVRYGFSKEKNAHGEYPRGGFIKNDWAKSNSGKDKAEFYLLYEYGIPSDAPRFLYFRDYTPGFSYYPKPIWSAAIRSAETEVEIINFKNVNVQQCFAPAGILQLPREMDEDQRKRAEMWFQSEGKGTDNAGKILVSFTAGDGGQSGIQWTPFTDVPLEKAATQVQEECQQEILTAFRVPSPLLIGLPGSGTLGGDGNTLAIAANEWFSKVIEPIRNRILNQLNKVIGDFGHPEYQVEVELTLPNYGDTATPANF